MKEQKELLEVRKKLKAKKPKFLRQDAHKKGRVSNNWRKPKGLQSKMRLNKKGYRKSVTTGWKSPAAVRGMDKSGLIPIIINNIKDMLKLDKNIHGIIIAKKVGIKKREDIVLKAKEAGMKILNIDDPENYLKNIKENMKQRKDKKKKIEKDKQKKKEEHKKDKEEEEKKEKEELNEEDTKKKEKQEKDKLLTKKH